MIQEVASMLCKRILLFISAMLILVSALCAQTGVGQIQGTISDSSGAVIPNAIVALDHVQTETKFQTTTNSAGSYVFPSLQTGEYRLTVTVPGMQKWEAKATL